MNKEIYKISKDLYGKRNFLKRISYDNFYYDEVNFNDSKDLSIKYLVNKILTKEKKYSNDHLINLCNDLIFEVDSLYFIIRKNCLKKEIDLNIKNKINPFIKIKSILKKETVKNLFIIESNLLIKKIFEKTNKIISLERAKFQEEYCFAKLDKVYNSHINVINSIKLLLNEFYKRKKRLCIKYGVEEKEFYKIIGDDNDKKCFVNSLKKINISIKDFDLIKDKKLSSDFRNSWNKSMEYILLFHENKNNITFIDYARNDMRNEIRKNIIFEKIMKNFYNGNIKEDKDIILDYLLFFNKSEEAYNLLREKDLKDLVDIKEIKVKKKI